MAEAAAHGAAIAQAIKASGVVVRVETVDFLRLLNRQDEPIVVRAPGGFFQAPWRYLTTYKGLAFVADSNDALTLPGRAEVIDAGKIWVPG